MPIPCAARGYSAYFLLCALLLLATPATAAPFKKSLRLVVMGRVPVEVVPNIVFLPLRGPGHMIAPS